MLRIIITDEPGTVLGSVTIDQLDLNPRTGKLDPQWIGQQVIDELPGDRDALAKLLGKPNNQE
jgi:hypothetical protein